MNKNSISAMTAADIMCRDLIVIAPGETLREAMALMTENHVTGLPVVDAKSRCVGLISSSDILSYEQEHSEFLADTNDDMAEHFNVDTQRWESVRVTSFALEEFGDVRVEEVMARELVHVTRDTRLIDVARLMVKSNVHRVLVLDEELRLYGIISAIDFVTLVARDACSPLGRGLHA